MNTNLASKIWTPTTNHINIQHHWIQQQIETIKPTQLNKLFKAAIKVRDNAYAPYSKYKVGASLLSITGKIYSSCNAETSTYTETDHAEQSVITQAIADNQNQKNFIKAIAISHSELFGPCGSCRQRIAEHASNALIFNLGTTGNIKYVTSLKILLPNSS